MFDVKLPNCLVVMILKCLMCCIAKLKLPDCIREVPPIEDFTPHLEAKLEIDKLEKFPVNVPLYFKSASLITDILTKISKLSGSSKPILILHNSDDRITN